MMTSRAPRHWTRRVAFIAGLGMLLLPLACDRGSALAPLASMADAKDPASKSGGDDGDAPPAAAKPTSKPAEEAAAGDDQPAAHQTGADDADEAPEVEHPFPRHRAAPSLDGGVAWINTAGPLDLKDLRGKFVVLDFWTYCCINCMHVLPELKKLEHAYPNNVVVIGVHSAKFDGEQDSKNITDAVQRYEIEHPVINDANHVIWDKYFSQSWPTLRIVDPEGNLVAGDSGEVTFDILDMFIKKALPYYRQKGVLDEKPLHFDLAANRAEKTPLRFPGKVLADEASGRLFIADSNHNRIVVATLAGKLIETIGSGEIGKADGGFAQAQFDHPQGMALAGETLYVADTENHLLRKVDLAAKEVKTIAGTGKQGHGWPGLDQIRRGLGGLDEEALPKRWVDKPKKTAISSPWALHVHEKQLYIAMAGPHQIWRMPLDESEIGPYAGNGREDIVDGPLLPRRPYDPGYAAFAQPSGLSGDEKWLYVADSEGSSIRAVPFDPEGEVRTIVGTAALRSARLFTFGDVDGKGSRARLQHCLDVVHAAGRLYVADTYNNKIKVIDPETETCKSFAGTGDVGTADDPAEFDEPAGICYASGKLFVADTNNHLIRTIDIKKRTVKTLEIKGLTPPEPVKVDAKPSFPGATQVKLPEISVQPVDGKVQLDVSLELPDGWKINPEAPQRYLVESVVEGGVVDRAKLGKLSAATEPAAKFRIDLPLTSKSGHDQLKVSLAYYYCQEGPSGLCKTGSVVWTVPFKIAADAKADAVPLHQKVE